MSTHGRLYKEPRRMGRQARKMTEGLDVLGTDALGAQKRSCLKYNLILFFNCLVTQTLTTKT